MSESKRPIGKRERKAEHAAETVVDRDAPTHFGPQFDAHAWSQWREDEEPAEQYHHWSRTLKIALPVTVAGIAALSAALWFSPHAHGHNEPEVTPQPSPVASPPPADTTSEPPAPIPMPDLLVPDAQPITHDGEFLQTVHQHGLPITNPTAAVRGAQIVCSNLAIAASTPPWMPEHWAPHSAVAYYVWHDDPTTPPGWTLADCRFVVDTAAAFYCPER